MTRHAGAIGQVVVGAFWLGASVLLAVVVAPAAFAVLPTRTLAGDIVGRVLPVIFWSGMAAAAAIMVFGVWTDATSRFKPRVLFAALAGTACALAQFIVDNWIERLRARMGVPVDSLPVNNPLRIAFGQLHVFSVFLLGVAMVGIAVAVVLAVRDLRTRS
jgi:hypothetical protein